mgnify:FL=1
MKATLFALLALGPLLSAETLQEKLDARSEQAAKEGYP